ncbi:MAG: hypothetical protein KDB35_16140, partial [Acidimicrobiales bacterium]|nr:hypothetical protein [Acidimicrobiales bacterium]
AEMIAASDAIVTFDPNPRPAALPDAGALRARFNALLLHLDVVKLSDEDAGILFPGLQPDDVLDAVLGTGTGLAILTRGARGAVLATTERRIEFPANPAKVVDTIGAGDSYMAAVLARVARIPKADLADALTAPGVLEDLAAFAARASAVTVGRPGADPPWAPEIQVDAWAIESV